MGAAASVRMLYKDALAWFKQYIDTATYIEDFKSMDKHNENALSFADVRDWIIKKCDFDSRWKIFLTSGPVLSIAHKNACKHGDSSSSVSAPRVVEVTEFKTLLVHLFATSILWRHFLNADQWSESGGDTAGCKQLNYDAFKLACRTFSSANAKEDLTDDQIKADFFLLDVNQSNTIGFMEVCNYCCRFIDDPEIEKRASYINIPKFFGDIGSGMTPDHLQNMLTSGPKTYNEVATIDEKNSEMIGALLLKLACQGMALQNATKHEHENNIIRKYLTIENLITHPVCCGFFLLFCQSQHNAENLSFIREIDEFCDLFSADTDLWRKEWRDIDASEKIDEEEADDDTHSITEGDGPLDRHISNLNPWISSADEKVVINKMASIIKTFLMKDSTTQINISESTMNRTLKRIKLLHLYGPSVFEEACIDPITTMKKDILPRFKDSDIVNTMVMRVASCEPPPPAAEFRTPPPDSLLLNLYSSNAFPDTRCFTLDEIIGNQNLYNSFLFYLQRNQYHADRLQCIRKIEIFNELMLMNCMKEATDEAWHIFKYFITEGAAHIVTIPHFDRKLIQQLMSTPKKNMFSSVRTAAYVLLTKRFDDFTRTFEYKGLPKLMRSIKDKSESPGQRNMGLPRSFSATPISTSNSESVGVSRSILSHVKLALAT